MLDLIIQRHSKLFLLTRGAKSQPFF